MKEPNSKNSKDRRIPLGEVEIKNGPKAATNIKYKIQTEMIIKAFQTLNSRFLFWKPF